MAYENGLELLNDVLFRAGEPQSSASDYYTVALQYINRVYRTIATGSSEYLPSYIDDWWWLRDRKVLTLDPVFEDGTVAVTEGSLAITFSDPPAYSMAGWAFRVGTHPEVYRIDTHTAAAANATLDAEYVQADDSAATFEAMHVEYSLDSSVQAVIGPMIGYDGIDRIHGAEPEALDRDFPLARLKTGIPRMFCLIDEETVRFSHGGPTDGRKRRVEYRFRPYVTDLTATEQSTPLIPLQWRSILADMAVCLVLTDKNDDRAADAKALATAMLGAMVRENRRRLPKIDGTVGKIFPRQADVYNTSRYSVGYTADGV